MVAIERQPIVDINIDIDIVAAVAIGLQCVTEQQHGTSQLRCCQQVQRSVQHDLCDQLIAEPIAIL